LIISQCIETKGVEQQAEVLEQRILKLKAKIEQAESEDDKSHLKKRLAEAESSFQKCLNMFSDIDKKRTKETKVYLLDFF
jgi:hypothetical protein